MTLNLFDLDLHRIAHLSNIQNFGDENLYNFFNINIISLHLGGFWFSTTSSIFSGKFIKIGSVVCSKYQKKRAYVRFSEKKQGLSFFSKYLKSQERYQISDWHIVIIIKFLSKWTKNVLERWLWPLSFCSMEQYLLYVKFEIVITL